MAEQTKKAKKPDKNHESELMNQIAGLTADLQRTRADFENYRKRVDHEKVAARTSGKSSAILQLLPIIDTLERAVAYIPSELHDNKWAQGIAGIQKNLDKSLQKLDITRIDAKPGTVFNPELHQAIQIDDAAEGDEEVVSEELQAGYLLAGVPIRHAMVKVTRQ